MLKGYCIYLKKKKNSTLLCTAKNDEQCMSYLLLRKWNEKQRISNKKKQFFTEGK